MSSKLERAILVLNKCYQPTYIATTRDALILLIGEKAVVLDENFTHYNFAEWMLLEENDEQERISTPNHKIKIPSVIKLLDYDEIQAHLISFSRENLYMRDNYTCQYCGEVFTRKELTIDHVIPKSRRKDFKMSNEEIRSWTNVTTACKECNMRKGSKTPEEAKMPLLSVPRRPKWLSQIRGLYFKNDINPIWKIFLINQK